MDLSRLSRGEQIAGISGIVLLLSMWIFDWFSYDAGGGVLGVDVSVGGDAWEVFSFIDIVIFLAAISGIALAIAAASASEVNAPVAISALTAGLGVLALVLIIFRIISPPDQDLGDAVDVSRSFGVWVGLVASAGVAYGGWAAMQEEGTTFSGSVGGSTTAPPPPPSQPPAA